MSDKLAVQDVITKMVNSIDMKEWTRARSQFADMVFVDYSSMDGHAGADVPADDLVGSWETLLVKAGTHHMLTNFEIEVEADRAQTQCHVYASHVAEDIEY